MRPQHAMHTLSTALTSARTLIGDEVVNRDGEVLGKIEDIMLNMYTGRIDYVVLSLGDLFGVGQRLFAVSWKSLEMDIHTDRLILDTDKDHPQDAPAFITRHWFDLATLMRKNEAFSYYRQSQYWQH